MYRRLGPMAALAVMLAGGLEACLAFPDSVKDEKKGLPRRACTLVLTLPESSDPPSHAPDRVTTLTVNGKDHSSPHELKRMIKVPVGKKAQATVVYSFWPNTYTNIIRTKVVALKAGKQVRVDLTKEGDGVVDQIKPIYYPTPVAVGRAMCKMAKVGKGDVVMDIGCGDGRLVIQAVKEFGAKKGIGIDINPDLIKKCRENAKKAGVADRVDFRVGDANKINDVSEASVVLLYLGDFLNLKIRPALRGSLKPGSRVVSHRFKMGDWAPDKTETKLLKNNYDMDEEYVLHLWTIKRKK